MNNAYQLIIFDWDGTIMNSAARITKCMQHMEKTLNLPVHSDTQIQQFIGLSLATAILQLHPSLTDEQTDQAVAIYREVYLGHPFASDLFEGAKTLIQTLHAHYTLAIATGKGRLGLNKALDQYDLAPYFTASRTADETSSKPNPQMLEELLIETGTPVEQALMIGDTTFDLEMAKNIGMHSLGVSYGVHDIQQLESAHPQAIIDSPKALQDWLMNT